MRPRNSARVLLAAAVGLLLLWPSAATAETKYWYDDNGPGWTCQHPPDQPSEKVCRQVGYGSPTAPEPLSPCEKLRQSWARHSAIAATPTEDLPPELARRSDDVQAAAFEFAAKRLMQAKEHGCDWATH